MRKQAAGVCLVMLGDMRSPRRVTIHFKWAVVRTYSAACFLHKCKSWSKSGAVTPENTAIRWIFKQ